MNRPPLKFQRVVDHRFSKDLAGNVILDYLLECGCVVRGNPAVCRPGPKIKRWVRCVGRHHQERPW